MKTKIIQLSTASSSFAVKDYEQDIFRAWYAQVAEQLKKANQKLDIECWGIERKYKKEKKLSKNNIKFRIFPTSISIRHGMEISLKMLEELLKKMKKNKLIIHFHEHHSWLVYCLLLFMNKKNVKIIAQHHGGRNPLASLKKYKRLALFLPIILLMQFFEKLLFKKVDVFYALSDEEIGYLKEITNSEAKFQTMGISDEYFKSESKIKARNALGLGKNKKYVLYIGRIKTTKGIKEILDAAKKINAEFILLGEGPDLEKYKKYARENKIKNASFIGAVYSRKKLLYLSACDCLVLPSYTEGAPVVLMEAIARNLPVVASNVGGVAKMIENRREGIIIKPKSSEEIVKAINEVLAWKKKNIKKYAEKYKWKKIIRETLKDYFN